MKKVFCLIIILLMACHPEHRRDALPDHPNRSKHNPEIPRGSKYSIPAHVNSDTGDLPSWKHTATKDSSLRIQKDTASNHIPK